MRTIIALAMLFGSSAFALAHPSHHHAHISQPYAERFMGLSSIERMPPNRFMDDNSCNGGPCSLSGGPSGGPNQT